MFDSSKVVVNGYFAGLRVRVTTCGLRYRFAGRGYRFAGRGSMFAVNQKYMQVAWRLSKMQS